MHIAFVVVGYVSMILTSAAYFPQIITMIIHRSGKNISYCYLGVLALDICLYAVYAIGIWTDTKWDAFPMLVGCIVQISLVLMLAVLKCMFHHMKKSQESDEDSEEFPTEVEL